VTLDDPGHFPHAGAGNAHFRDRRRDGAIHPLAALDDVVGGGAVYPIA
jgi:hypothetical protein